MTKRDYELVNGLITVVTTAIALFGYTVVSTVFVVLWGNMG